MATTTLEGLYNTTTAPWVTLARAQASDAASVRNLVPPSILVTQYTSEFANRPAGDAVAPTATSFTSLALALYDAEISGYVDTSIFAINENASSPATWYAAQRSTTPGIIFSNNPPPFNQ